MFALLAVQPDPLLSSDRTRALVACDVLDIDVPGVRGGLVIVEIVLATGGLGRVWSDVFSQDEARNFACHEAVHEAVKQRLIGAGLCPK